MDNDGPERKSFLQRFKETTEAFGGLVRASEGATTAAAMTFRSAHISKFPHTMDKERLEATSNGILPPWLSTVNRRG